MGGIYAATEIHARLLRVFPSIMAAATRETKEVRPVMQPRSVVCKVVNPNDFMISEYWLVNPFAISCDHE